MINWIRGWLERRRSRRVVPWESCEINIPAWRKRMAEEQYKKMMLDHHMAIFRIQMDTQLKEIECKYSEAIKASKTAKRQSELADAQIKALRP